MTGHERQIRILVQSLAHRPDGVRPMNPTRDPTVRTRLAQWDLHNNSINRFFEICHFASRKACWWRIQW